jgi:Leucine-rich repeat (LRR) protein
MELGDPAMCAGGKSLFANLRVLNLRGNSLRRVPPGWLGGGGGGGGGGRGGGEGEGGGGGGGGCGSRDDDAGVGLCCAWTSSLTHVDLSLNKLDALPDAVGALRSLTALHVSNNRLASAPASLARCQELRQLWLSNNRLTQLPKGVPGGALHVESS